MRPHGKILIGCSILFIVASFLIIRDSVNSYKNIKYIKKRTINEHFLNICWDIFLIICVAFVYLFCLPVLLCL